MNCRCVGSCGRKEQEKKKKDQRGIVAKRRIGKA